MEVVNEYLQHLCNGNISDENQKKISFALKYYISRVCYTARDPKIIQLNHYIDDVYASNDNNKYKRVVLSPSKVPFPIAFLLNYSLIKKDKSKFFYINKKEEITIHPYEYIIPVFIAYFSDNIVSQYDNNIGKLFLSSIIVCGELAMILINYGKTSQYVSVCIAVVMVIGNISSLAPLSTDNIVYIIDEIISTNSNIDLQICLQMVCAASYSPNYLSRCEYLPNNDVNSMFAYLDAVMKITNDMSYSSLESVQFCILRMGPLCSLLSAALHSYSDIASIVIDSSMVTSNEREKFIETFHKQLLQLIEWNDNRLCCHHEDQQCFLTSKLGGKTQRNVQLLLDNNMIDGNDVSCHSIVLNGQDGDSTRLPLSQLTIELSNLHVLLLSSMQWNAQAVIGVSATDIIFNNIDTIVHHHSMIDALALLFERPGLD